MANKKVTVTYNNSTILDEVVLSNSNIVYNNTTIISDGVYSNKILNCNGKVMQDNITIGDNKILNCSGKIMQDNVTITSVDARLPGDVTTIPVNLNPTRVTYHESELKALCSAGIGTGTIMYSTDGSNFSTSIPTTNTVGTYTVYYYAAESTNYTQSATGSVTCYMHPDYLCFTANTAGSTVKCPQAFQYSTNRTSWSTASTSTAITLSSVGSKIYVRNGSVGTPTSQLGTFEMTGSIAASGNIMSLVDNTCSSTTIPCSACYEDMFSDCTSLTTAPELPATTLEYSCYEDMFSGCRSLTTAPSLPATTLAYDCYFGMFEFCNSLTTAPSLPATTLADDCYEYMFTDCTSLTTAPELPATTLAYSCYERMFQDCLSLTTAPSLPATTLEYCCYYSMFEGCTSLTTAPSLPATTLEDDCYFGMFSGCTSLIVSNTSGSGYSKAWRIPASGTFTSTYNQSYMFSSCPRGSGRSQDSMPGAAGASYTYYTQNTPVS